MVLLSLQSLMLISRYSSLDAFKAGLSARAVGNICFGLFGFAFTLTSEYVLLSVHDILPYPEVLESIVSF